MAESLRALLRDSIDYAGTFPPASLSLEQAAQNYSAYRRQREAWMLGRMVCPVSQLAEIAALWERETPVEDSPRVREGAVSAVLTGGSTAEAWRENVEGEIRLVREFGQRLRIDVLEVKLPLHTAGQGGKAEWAALLDGLNADELKTCRIFLELPREVEPWDAAFRGLVDALVEFNRRAECESKLAFKLRTGGVKPEAFLSSAQLASVICALRDAELPWKATAGLHHPLPGLDAELGVRRQGFINVLTAAAMADALKLPKVDVQNILEDDDPLDFQFAGPSLSWEGLSVEVPQIDQARRRSFASFGSCSFDEPRADLRALGWL
ncbi:MAG TPA: hypothetical protein VHC19_17965 [Pirellulales bacterium]|nr:hypothetical protein [Pirellulales bacterium]